MDQCSEPYLYRFLSRGLDILLSAVVLSVGFCQCTRLLPFFIKLTSIGPVFYTSPRLGLLGKEFTCWKFRSMHVGADARLAEVLHNNTELFHEWNLYRKLKNDPRLTTIGKLLRKTSLDEFPQFWNVLLGGFKLSWPPSLSAQRERANGRSHRQRYDSLFSVRPGLTGIWQTSGRNELSFEQEVKAGSRGT